MPKLVNQIRALLASRAALEQFANAPQREVIRALTMLLNDPDEHVRQRASCELGQTIRQLEPPKIDEFLRRLMWRINPESGDNTLGIPEAFGEIGARAPEQVRPFVPVLLQYAGDVRLLPGILQALGRIGAKLSQIADPHHAIIVSALQSAEPAVFANAALALLRIDGPQKALELFGNDRRKIRIFREHAYMVIEVRELVQATAEPVAGLCFISSEHEGS